MATANNKEDEARELFEYYLAQNVNGFFFAPLESSPNREAMNAKILAKCGRASVLVVLLDRCKLPFPKFPFFDLVGAR